MGNGTATAAIRVFPVTIDWPRLLLCAAVFGLVGYAFWGQLVERDLTCYQWMTGHWFGVSNYSHGPLIPLIASFLLYWNIAQRKPEHGDWSAYWRAVGAGGAALGIWLVGSAINPDWESAAYTYAMWVLPLPLAWQVWTLREHLRSDEPPQFRAGLAVIGVAMAIYYIGVKAVQPRIVVGAGVVLLYGLVLATRGPAVWRLVFFPISFLFLMVPLNFLDNAIGFPLRMFVATAATNILNFIGIETIQRGSGIISSVFRFDVADPCSGIRSLMALTTVTAAYAYVTQHAQWKRWFLFLCAVPLAVLGNLARVISIALVAQVYGMEFANKVYHDWSGFILFPVALAAMVLVGILLNLPYGRLIHRWTQPPETPRERHE
jgi:exosortase